MLPVVRLYIPYANLSSSPKGHPDVASSRPSLEAFETGFLNDSMDQQSSQMPEAFRDAAPPTSESTHMDDFIFLASNAESIDTSSQLSMELDNSVPESPVRSNDATVTAGGAEEPDLGSISQSQNSHNTASRARETSANLDPTLIG